MNNKDAKTLVSFNRKVPHLACDEIFKSKMYLLFLLRSKYSRLINDAMAGGNIVISLSLSDSTLNSWH